MANIHTTLTSLFSATANAIRTKTGSNAPIVADNLPSAVSGINTLSEGSADATATAGDLVRGRTAYARGQKLTGSIPINGDGLQANSCGVNSVGLFYYIPRGYYNGNNPWVYSSPQSVANAIGLTAKKIVYGNTILGITGTGGVEVSLTISIAFSGSAVNGVYENDGVPNFKITNTTTGISVWATPTSPAVIIVVSGDRISIDTDVWGNGDMRWYFDSATASPSSCVSSISFNNNGLSFIYTKVSGVSAVTATFSGGQWV